MAWKRCNLMEERLRFVARALEGESMSSLCREFGISRKTGYKFYNRYKDNGIEGLFDRTRRPIRFGNQLPIQIETALLRLKREKPRFGARKIRELFKRKYPDYKLPALSTVHAVFDRNGLVTKKARRRKYKSTGTALSIPKNPNDLWCTDYKGQFKLGNKRYCYPLTITDSALSLIHI